jgi:hypothetical protein
MSYALCEAHAFLCEGGSPRGAPAAAISVPGPELFGVCARGGDATQLAPSARWPTTTGGRVPETSRVPACETFPRAPHPVPTSDRIAMRPRGAGRLSIAYGRAGVNMDNARSVQIVAGALAQRVVHCRAAAAGLTQGRRRPHCCSAVRPRRRRRRFDFKNPRSCAAKRTRSVHHRSFLAELRVRGARWLVPGANAGAGHCRPCSPRSIARDASAAAPR